MLAPGKTGVIVNGWDLPPLTVLQNYLIRLVEFLRRKPAAPTPSRGEKVSDAGVASGAKARGTFVRKHTPAWLKQKVGNHMPVEIWCWRSVSVRYMRTFVHNRLGGQAWLGLLYWLEERFPHFFGKNGQYPLIVIRKNQS